LIEDTLYIYPAASTQAHYKKACKDIYLGTVCLVCFRCLLKVKCLWLAGDNALEKFFSQEFSHVLFHQLQLDLKIAGNEKNSKVGFICSLDEKWRKSKGKKFS